MEKLSLHSRWKSSSLYRGSTFPPEIFLGKKLNNIFIIGLCLFYLFDALEFYFLFFSFLCLELWFAT